MGRIGRLQTGLHRVVVQTVVGVAVAGQGEGEGRLVRSSAGVQEEGVDELGRITSELSYPHFEKIISISIFGRLEIENR